MSIESSVANMIVGMSMWEIVEKTGIISGVATVMSLGIRWIVTKVTTSFHSRATNYTIRFKAELPEHFLKHVRFRCLLIRYGTDQYIEKMASDLDRQNGQLQNRIIDIGSRRIDSTTSEFSLVLPVHRRLGTQFKCFADITLQPDDPADLTAEAIAEEVKQFLENTGKIDGISPSSSEYEHRVYFLLRRFATVTSVEGFKNNHCFPE